MTDLISRADAIEAIPCGLCYDKSNCVKAIEALPSTKLPKGDLISRADAIDAVKKRLYETAMNNMEHGDIYADIAENRIDIWLSALPSAELSKGDLISRADVLKYPIRLDHYDEVNGSREFVYGVESVIEYVESLPSADAEQTDKLENQPRLVERNYTTEGGGGEIYHPTRQQGEWIPIEETLPTYDGGEKTWLTGMKCSNCGKLFDLRVGYHYCPSCGAIMKGGAE